MSGVLHPVGPEPAQTYWIRRGVVLAALAVVISLLVGLTVNLTQAANASGPEAPPAGAADSATPSPSAGPSSSTPLSSITARVERPGSASPTATAGGSARTPARARATKPPTPACDPSQVRVTLTGPPRVKAAKKARLEVSLINGGPQRCRVAVGSQNFALTIVSGTDRIWSTRDCLKSLTSKSAVLDREAALIWKVTWNGRRSFEGCRTRPETPRPGTYVATARFAGAEPVRFRMLLTG